MALRSPTVNALNISIDTIQKKKNSSTDECHFKGKKIIILYIFYNVIIVNIN